MNYTVAKIKENNSNRYILQSENKYFAINELLFEILSEYKLNRDYENISLSINNKFQQNDLTDKSLIENSIKQVKQMLEKKLEEPAKKTYIHNKFNILKDSTGDSVYSALSFLFNQKMFFFSLSGLLIMTFSFFYFNNLGFSKSIEHFQKNLTWIDLSLYYIAFFAIIFIHEIGHATSSFSFGAKPKEIGFGLYFIFPVMYTNTTNAWKLDKVKRIIVNLGGIYFQLIINLLLILLFYFSSLQSFSLSLLIMNTASIMTSFNPFFRYDGYWIYSDFFQIQNLREKSTKFMEEIIRNPLLIMRSIKEAKPALLVYSISNLFFWMYVYYSVVTYVLHKAADLKIIFENKNFCSFDLLKIIFSIVFILIGFLNIIIKTYNLKKNNNGINTLHSA